MKVSTISSTFALAALTTATPASRKPQFSQQLATYDDLPAVPAVPEVNTLGVYKGLNYTAFDVNQLGVGGAVVAGIVPQSGAQVANTDISQQLLQGDVGPAISVAPGFRSFDLQSLYIACAVNSVESAVGVPQQCTVAFTAYRPGSPEPFQTINKQFNPTNAVRSKMMKVNFPQSFFGTERVDIAVVQSTSGSQTTGLFFDNVAYTLRK